MFAPSLSDGNSSTVRGFHGFSRRFVAQDLALGRLGDGRRTIFLFTGGAENDDESLSH